MNFNSINQSLYNKYCLNEAEQEEPSIGLDDLTDEDDLGIVLESDWKSLKETIEDNDLSAVIIPNNNSYFLILDNQATLLSIINLMDWFDEKDLNAYTNYNWGYSNQYTTCDGCGTLINYVSVPHNYLIDSKGNVYCEKCVRENPQTYIETLINSKERYNTILDEESLIDNGFELVQENESICMQEDIETLIEENPNSQFIFSYKGKDNHFKNPNAIYRRQVSEAVEIKDRYELYYINNSNNAFLLMTANNWSDINMKMKRIIEEKSQEQFTSNIKKIDFIDNLVIYDNNEKKTLPENNEIFKIKEKVIASLS